MDTGQVDHDLKLLPAWRRGLLLGLLLALGGGYIGAFAFFVEHSEDFVERQIDAKAADYACAHRLELPATLNLGQGSPDLARLGNGWNTPEIDGVWTRDTDASLLVCVLPRGDLMIDIDLRSFVARRHPAVAVELVANDTVLAQWQTRVGQNRIAAQVRLPGAVVGDGRIKLTLRVDTPASPLSMRSGPDMRRLGVFVSRLAIVPADDS